MNAGASVETSRLLKAALGAALAGALLTGAWGIAAAVGTSPDRPDITDFHAVHLVGRLIADGEMARAYHPAALLRLETLLGGRPVFIPWSYPPAYGVVAGPLFRLGLVPGFLAFGAGGLALFVMALRRLGAADAWPVLMAFFVPLMLNLRCGQNGLLTGGLAALAAGFALRHEDRRAGLALAALSLKPHLALALPAALALRRRWRLLGVAAAGTAALTLASLLAFGPGTFAAFLGSFAEVSRLMAAGAYPLHRMTSLYAFALSLGLPPAAALAAHAGAALLVLARAAPRLSPQGDPRVALGTALVAGLFVSPYVYDYDQTMLAVALVLLAPALRVRLGARGFVRLAAGCGLAASLGLAVNTVTGGAPDGALAPMGPALLTAALTILHRLGTEAPSMRRLATELPGAEVPAR